MSKINGSFSRSSTSGAILVASGAIGAGMFSLPLAAASVAYPNVLIVLLLVWLMTLWVTVLLARINLSYPPGTSFDSMVNDILGARWKAANTLSVWFIFSILLYAYFTAGGGILKETTTRLGVLNSLALPAYSLVFGFVIAAVVWTGSRRVSLICAVFLVCMIASFGLATGGLFTSINSAELRYDGTTTFTQTTVLVPYFVTAFACGGLVPSLVKHYQGRDTSVVKSILVGTFATFLIYVVWMTANLGVLERVELETIAKSGGGVAQLSAALQSHTSISNLPLILNLFSHLAITTSFLGISLSLFDFIADRFKFENTPLGRSKTAFVTFIPPAVLSMLAPTGFVLAIGYAGLAVLFSFFIVPGWMARKRGLLRLPALIVIIAFSFTAAVSKLVY